jgi:hypothetical protein
MLKLYEAADRIEAQILKDRLRDQGIESVILGDYLTGAMGELPANIYPQVWVLEDEALDQAQRLLRDFTKNYQRTETAGDWCCPICGEKVDAEFDVCWNCATPRIQAKSTRRST